MALKDMSKFQLVFTGVFAAAIIGGVMTFALYKGDGSADISTNLTVWGELNSESFMRLTEESGLRDAGMNFTYEQKSRAAFETDFIEALAEGAGPDLVFIGQDQVLKHSSKFFLLPYESLDQRVFKDTYVQGTETLLHPNGIVAIPVGVDPLVMFWNRNIFQNAALSQPPRYWDEFFALSRTLTKKDGALNIVQSAIALGEYANVAHAKEILSTLMMQAGTPIVVRQNGALSNVFNNQFDLPLPPAQAAVNFYTEFSNPAKAAYSWNRSLPNSKESFIAGDLAVYLGYGSELYDIQDKNPNLNFDVTYVPQSRESADKITYGRVIGVAIVKNSRNIAAAAKAAVAFSNWSSGTFMVRATGYAPVRRDIIAEKPTTAHGVVLYNSALWSRGWLDPDNIETDIVFKDMIESITAGRARTSEAVGRASSELTELLRKLEPKGSTVPSVAPAGI